MKLKNIKKKGFTIVELVIVIGVIAVLAAVLIPTFINLTNKANKASDESLVTSLNKALAIEEVDHDIDNMHDAVDSLKREGYLASALVTKSDQKLLYNLEENRFLLEEDRDDEKYADYADHEFWTIAKTYDSTKPQNYSIYAADDFDKTEVSGLKVGFDAGDCSTISSIEYVGVADDQTVILRSNGGGVTVDAAANKVKHYGIANVVDIKAVAPSSYYENGIVSIAKIKTGRIVVTPKAVLTSLHLVSTNNNYNGIKVGVVGNAQLPSFTRDDITLNSGDKKLVIEVQTLANEKSVDEHPQYVWVAKEGETVSTAVASSAEVLDSTTIIPEASQSKTSKAAATEAVEGTTQEELEEMIEVAQRYAGGQGTEKNPYLLATKAHFGSIDEDIHDGLTAGKFFKLATDIDLGEMSPLGWMTLSGKPDAQSYTITGSESFSGSLDGNNHTLKYSISIDSNYAASTVGLFGSIQDSYLHDITLDADINCSKTSTWVGAIAGFGKSTNLKNVTVNGNVYGMHDVAGFFGYYGDDSHNSSNFFEGCVNNATVTNKCDRSPTKYSPTGGFVGQMAFEDNDYTLTFKNCVNNGAVSTTDGACCATSHFVGFVSDQAALHGYDIRVCFDNCSVGKNGSVSATIAKINVVGNKSVYCCTTDEAVAVCPTITYVGITEKLTSANASPTKIYVNNTLQDLSLYIVQ